MKASVLLGLASVTAALPAEPKGQAFSIKAKYNANAKLDLAAEALHLTGKYFSKRDDNGTVSAIPRLPGERLYTSEVEIGTPPQKLDLDFDTGSSDTWVFSNDTDPLLVNGHTLYQPGNSTTAKLLSGLTWSIRYGDNSSSSGIVYSDVFSIGGVSVENQAIESAKTVSSVFSSISVFSGLLGLGYDQGNTIEPTKKKTWFSNVMSQLKQPLFTVRLTQDDDGTYNFGYINKTQYTGEIAYTPAFATKYGHRLFNASGYSVGNGSVRDVNITAIPDTGSSLFALPNEIAADYWSQVRGSLPVRGPSDEIQYAYPCNSELPDFNVNIGNQTVTVPGKYMKYVEARQPGICYGGITGGDSIAPFAIFGDVFLKGVFVVFDDGKERIGFANGA